jgi:endonuclease-3 related protein
MARATTSRRLLRVYQRLRAHYGDAGWWPAKTAFEVSVGAILTQNTSWSNVEKALGVLKRRRMLSFRALKGLPASRLAPLIRSSGTYKQKARTLGAFVAFLEREYRGNFAAMARERPERVRRQLLAVQGIGPETADSIALYAADRPLFVVDAYTRRLFARLGLLSGTESYDDVQRFFMTHLRRGTRLFGDYHAQIVRLAKDVCRKRPRCGACPLEDLCPRRGVGAAEWRTS